ncbi:MAG: rod shape-determining protein RodA [Bacteroidaceae bacterium]|nr:rod shape-determining protein RodA [Bacteroidaceae bacterium]
MRQNQNNKLKGPNLMASIDWFTILIYMMLLAMGWMSVCGASYDLDQGGSIVDFSTRSGMQIVWIGTSLLLGALILMTDDRLIEALSYIIYIGFLVLLAATPFLAHDIKGSMSWIKIGTFSIQPAEFAKFGTALCIAKVMSSYGFNLSRCKDFVISVALIVVPMVLIVLQRETGSALVYSAFFLMLYREGMPGCVLFAGIAAVVYFVIGVRYSEVALLGISQMTLGQTLVLMHIQLFTIGLIWVYTKNKAIGWQILGWGTLASSVAMLFARFIFPCNMMWVLQGVSGATVLYLLYRSIRDNVVRYFYIAMFTIGSLAFFYSANFVLNNVMEPHQQTRIRVLLGLEDDPRGAGYNVIQAKIAIGSGGLRGKGFLNGTQTKLKYVPEQDTDFIFCTVGEEEGFVGCAVVLLLFLALILRLIHLAERQPYAFGRIYGYCVMSVFLFHVFINVGMVLGLTPVIGIPLPFFSYGGSSLWGFTILLFVFLRIDAGRNRMKR